MKAGTHAVRRLAALELKRRIDAGDRLVLLDVREDHERAHCSIAVPDHVTDLHIPMGQLLSRCDEVDRATANHPTVVYCHLGERSMVVATWLARRGLPDVHNLEGGIAAWSAAVDPNVPRY